MNDKDPIIPGCPSLMPHTLPGGFDGVAPAEEGTPLPEPKDFAAKAKLHLVHAMTKHPYFADVFFMRPPNGKTPEDLLNIARCELNNAIRLGCVDSFMVLNCECCEIADAYVRRDKDQIISECYDAIAVLMRMIMFFEGTQKLGNPPTKGLHD